MILGYPGGPRSSQTFLKEGCGKVKGRIRCDDGGGGSESERGMKMLYTGFEDKEGVVNKECGQLQELEKMRKSILS